LSSGLGLRFTRCDENDSSELGCSNEERIQCNAVLTGLLFKWQLIRQIRERADGAGFEQIG
jgi:hypothetical protein